MRFDRPAIDRLAAFLDLPADSPEIIRLTPDASTREFFRIPWRDDTAIACLYPERFDQSLPQLDVTKLFLAAGLPVAEVYVVEYDHGLLIHEDFGDRILRQEFGEDPDRFLDAGIELIARIQNATSLAYERDSVASRRRFDFEKFNWELGFFKTHYFESLLRTTVGSVRGQKLEDEFAELSAELEEHSAILAHRDFHAANLMLVGNDLRIIDHQDARIGPPSYDLVSLLLDRIEEVPSEAYLSAKQARLLSEREKLGLGKIENFEYEFELVTVQRCLKAIGTFSNQAANFGKTDYLDFVSPMFRAVEHACVKLEKFPQISEIASQEAGRAAV